MRFFNTLLIFLGALVLWVDAQATGPAVTIPSDVLPPAEQSTNLGQPPSNDVPSEFQPVTPSPVISSPVELSSGAPPPVRSSPITPPADVNTTPLPAADTTALVPITTALQDSISITDPTPTPDQTLTTDSSPSSEVPTESSDDSSLETSVVLVTIPPSSATATSSITPTPCLSTDEKLSLSSCADTTNYYCDITISMCVPKQNDNANCTDNLMCHANSACQNFVCVPLASKGGSGGNISVGKVGIIAGCIAGLFILAGIAFWAYRFLSKRKENKRRMDEIPQLKTGSGFDRSNDYPFISRPNSFSNSGVPPPVVARPEMRTFEGATNDDQYVIPPPNMYGMPPPTNRYNQQPNNYIEAGNPNTKRSSKFNYLSSAFTRMRNSMGYGITNNRPENAYTNNRPENTYGKSPSPFIMNNGSRTDDNPQALSTNDLNVVTHDANFSIGNVDDDLENNSEENTTLRDSSVLPADDQDVFSLVSESPYLGLERNSDSSASEQTDKKRYKMGSMYSHYTESWGSSHMLDMAAMSAIPTASQNRKNLRDKKNTNSARTTIALPSDENPRQSVIHLNAPIFNNVSMRQNMGQQHLPQQSISSVSSSGFPLDYYNSSKANERTLAPTNARGRLVYSSTFGDESELSNSSGDENLTIEEKLSRQNTYQIDEDISEIERDIESVRKFADKAWDR